MNRRLADEGCRPCDGGASLLAPEELAGLMVSLRLWKLEKIAGVPRIVKTFPFKTFADGMAFARRIADLADAEDHHPTLLVEWGRVTVSWWTHSLGGLHRNDFVMAARTDRILDEGF
ncbi:MAG TPA: 4a-hydroxytetrahydrobiopterin dehydratase [Elusimicrobiota bacterium]|jgi:4a-hydroxytetrahydrobiopterin dehydratase|nr:4a-hydroxytetrahydrobiopterin dehydratase [Elusimicrobiota bacterium]HMX43409.1 4a-hydroxytetrahydrobiopterin dehydratase [Elusimicrobiota bacterium]HNA61141.1 4a-hydroxytetrahydrobiopterin dehydratase [Elusimicrobiota bacterium]HNC74712.1 4a-hydroxytetrahydrobiopterin dehydratase [Elusimicrobiota bacterium]HNG45872.1 4a-hydroxytetrahydrobiopterin dehydratase [Elusimicrobiota bacterium]